MPEFTPDEWDRCPHCGAVLYDPPNCCETMAQEHSNEMHRRYPATAWDDAREAEPDWRRELRDEPSEDDDA